MQKKRRKKENGGKGGDWSCECPFIDLDPFKIFIDLKAIVCFIVLTYAEKLKGVNCKSRLQQCRFFNHTVAS